MKWLAKWIRERFENGYYRDVVKCLEESNTHLRKRRMQLVEQANFWHGKFLVVKQENNALRKNMLKSIFKGEK